MVDDAFRKQLEGYSLATADILYRLPDHPKILQTFVWQTYDLAPEFPELKKFLDFWSHSIEGAIHSVRVRMDFFDLLREKKEIISPAQILK